MMPGQCTAKPPESPHANLEAVERAGVTKHGSAIWRVACDCGKTLVADAPAVKRGAAHCPDCNPTYGDLAAQRILAVLPATIDEIVKNAGMTLQQVKYRLTTMKPHLCHIGRWRRPRGSGACQPVLYAGHGEDAPCNLKPRTVADCNRRYRKRIKKAIERAAAGGKEDMRYTRHIALHLANETAKKSRIAPQPWFAALMYSN